MIEVLNLQARAAHIHEPWTAVEVARANDQAFQIAWLEGEYRWHEHPDLDELFYVLEGSLTIQLRNQADITLHSGELAVVPKGVQHCPKSASGCHVIMIEPVARG